MAINSLSAASKGLSGLASGIDTESIVESMLSGTQSKIDSQNQKKTVLEYKQEMYRSVVSDLQTFQSTYFSYTNQATNLLSQSFFESKSASTTSSSYTVTATNSATSGNVTVNSVKSLATNFKQTANNTASAIIAGTLDSEKLNALSQSLTDEVITLTIGTSTVDVSLADLAGKSSLKVESVLNAALMDGDTALATVKYVNGSFTLTAAGESTAFSVTGSDTALQLVGGSKISGTGSASFSVNTAAVLPTLKVTVDGVSKSITYNPLDQDTSIADQLNKSIASAFGSGITVSETDGKISFTTSNSSRKITITGDEDTMAALGLKKSVSNKIALNYSLADNYFAVPVVGQSQKFTINGVDFSFSSDQTISTIMNTINASDAGVKVSYSSTTDTFSIEATASGSRGSDYSFDISQSEGNLLTALFGIAPGNTTGNTLTAQLTSATIPTGDFSFAGGTVNLNVNGSTVSLTIPDSFSSADSFVSAINAALLTQFGQDSAENPNVSFVISGDGSTVSLNTSDDYTAYIYDDSLSALGFDSTVTGETTLADVGITDDVVFNINGSTLTFSSSTSINDMISQINTTVGSEVATFDETKAYIRICGVEIPMDFIDVSGKLFGQTEGSLSTQAVSTDPLFTVTDGSNAVVTINGVDVERSTNSFTVDGISINLLSETDTSSTITVTQDTDKIYDTVVKFIDDYNTLINSINELLDADATYKDYAPLTSAQEEEMTESQIEKWETKAKEGLLRNDSTLTSVLASLRRTLYTKPDGSVALYDLGITTSYFGTKDNLTIGDTSKLKTMIAEDPEAIMKLFTDTSSGLATQLNNAISNAARTSTVNPGSLVRIAGATGKTDTSSSIYKQIQDIEDSLDRLEDKYENEYERYWKQFNSMEELISNMNSTSSWLTSMLSSS